MLGMHPSTPCRSHLKTQTSWFDFWLTALLKCAIVLLMPKRFPVTIDRMPDILAWRYQEPQYANVKPKGPGITYFRPVFEPGPVDCLLMYNADLALVGIMNLYQQDMPPWEKAGNFTILVRPDRRRRGIATQLMDEARRRWTISFDQQDYSHDGAAFATTYVARHSLSDGTSRVTGMR
jgi:GNAT superfamily N-acetyltransferase